MDRRDISTALAPACFCTPTQVITIQVGRFSIKQCQQVILVTPFTLTIRLCNTKLVYNDIQYEK